MMNTLLNRVALRTLSRGFSGLALVLASGIASIPVHAQTTPAPMVAYGQPAGIGYSPGVADDKISWETFIHVVKPAPTPSSGKPFPDGTLTFESWATDYDTFVASPPVWPVGLSAQRFQVSALGKSHFKFDAAGLPTGVTCAPPGAPAAGNFPTPAVLQPPANCLAEEVRRNYPAFQFIKSNNFNTPAGLAANFPSATPISFPTSHELDKAAIEVKVDWIPVDTLITWLEGNNAMPADVTDTYRFVVQNYFITQQPPSKGQPVGTKYALLSMHISLKDRPNWLWATFEHQLNIGRCDTMGCYDHYGIEPQYANIAPRAVPNTVYPSCKKSSALQALMKNAGVLAIWDKYCLKSTQTEFAVSVATNVVGSENQSGHEHGPAVQIPVLGGDSVVERILANVPIAQSSCITCHANATFNSSGCISGTNPGLSNPAPIGVYSPLSGQKQFDFVWGFITGPSAPGCK